MRASLKVNWIACYGAYALAATAFSQVESGVPPSLTHRAETNQAAITREPGETQRFYHAKELVGATVKDTQGHPLGAIYDVLLNPKSGESFAAIAMDNGAFALVPSQVLVVTPAAAESPRKLGVTLDATKESLQAGPTINEKQWDRLDNPGFTDSIYIHYHLEAPLAVGRATGPGGFLTGVGTSTNEQSKLKTPLSEPQKP